MAKRKAPLAVASKSIDPTLNALFSASAGPVKAPPISRYSELRAQKAKASADEEASESGDDEVLSEISEELDDEDHSEDGEEENDSEGSGGDEDDEAMKDASAVASDPEEASENVVEAAAKEPITAPEATKSRKDRKRKRKEDNDDLEGKYLAELTKNDGPTVKRRKDLTVPDKDGDKADGEKDDKEEEGEGDDPVPVHESLSKEEKPDDLEKAARTVFLANVSTEAISSKSAKKTLLAHLSTILAQDASPSEKIESIRFRSLAFSTGSMPKRAAFITGSLMEATTKSANAYVVYPTPASARKAAAELNGTEVLGRHIRVDSVAHPSPTDHRRCVFVGNLGFVDDETMLNTNEDGETTTKKRTKVPADVEEGLWRTFGKVGKVENVRVIRDPKTRVGKGFAYVQFYDANDVEAALLLDEKKFPPMLPRKLRVTRAKDPRKTALAQERSRAKGAANDKAAPGRDTKYRPKITPEQQSMAGRAGKLLGRAGAAREHRASRKYPRKDAPAGGEIKTPEQIVFEGARASVKDGHKGLKFGKKAKQSAKPSGRGARRAAEWKKKKD